MGVFISAIFGLAFPYLGNRTLPLWPWIIAGIFWVWALLAPLSLKTIYRAWMRVGLVIGSVINRIVLGVVFYGVMLPMSLVMRMAGKDAMARKLDKSVKTYRIPSKHASRNNLERPF
jgi:predicted anti-sigma-YlaC factor YlaD